MSKLYSLKYNNIYNEFNNEKRFFHLDKFVDCIFMYRMHYVTRGDPFYPVTYMSIIGSCFIYNKNNIPGRLPPAGDCWSYSDKIISLYGSI